MAAAPPARKAPLQSLPPAPGDPYFPLTIGTTAAYACPNVAARDKRVRLNIPPIAMMRAPGEAEGNFALESLLDELSYELGMDPIELRLRNYAEVHPQTGLPWSSKALRECYQVGADRFGWARRDPAVGAMRDGRWLVGYGDGRGDLHPLPGQRPGACDDPPRRHRTRRQRRNRHRDGHLHCHDPAGGRGARAGAGPRLRLEPAIPGFRGPQRPADRV